MSAVAREVTLALDGFERPARELIASAQALADERKHAEVEPLHVLHRALERLPLPQRALRACGLDPDDLLLELELLLRALPKRGQGEAFLSQYTLALVRRAESASLPAQAGVVHVLSALALDPTLDVATALEACGLQPQTLRVALELSAQLPGATHAAGAAPQLSSARALPEALGRYTRELAVSDEPIVGRDAELRRVMQVLARSTGSQPLLVGEHGVGRRSVVRALVQRLAAPDAPLLAGARVLELDLAALASGTRTRAELEERMTGVLDALRKTDAPCVLYASDLGQLLSARYSPALDALVAGLGRGGARMIAVGDPAVLTDENAAPLLRHFVRVEVEAPSEAEAIAMVRAASARIAAAHGTRIEEEAITTAVHLARRYVPSAQLPKSALDLLDEAAALERIESRPATPVEGRTLGAAHVAAAVAAATGIPVARVQATEAEKLLALEAQLERRVIGQPAAVNALADAVRRGRVGLRDAKRPIGSFLFLGSSGVGKTELAKALAELLFDDEHALTRLDMSELMEKHTVSRLLGSPPGYADSEQGGFLTEAVRRRPYSVLLFDEIEKAHPDVFNLLLQVLDDGRLTDSRGRIAHFADTVIILTSNIGARLLMEAEDQAAAHEAVHAELRRTLRPELINRIDEIVIFEPLGKPELARILEIQLAALGRLLAPRGVTLRITDAAKQAIVELGYDPAFGARPLRRAIQQKIQDPLAQLLLAPGESGAAGIIEVDAHGAEFSLLRVS
jgi:ATP-dependent Clp protease ATP-binding subunit ClpC